MSNLSRVRIRHAAISGRVVLARFGKDPSVALETQDVMSDFFQALASYAFEGKMPERGDAATFSFGGGDEHFSVTVTRTAPTASDAAS